MASCGSGPLLPPPLLHPLPHPGGWVIAVVIIFGYGGEDDEKDSGEGEEDVIEVEPSSWADELLCGEVLVEVDVFDGSEGKGEALGKLDASDDGVQDEEVEEGHKADGTEEKEDGGGGGADNHDLGDGDAVGDGNGGDGLHGLDGHGDDKEEAGEGIVEGGEDEYCAYVEADDEGESEDDGDVGAEVTDGVGNASQTVVLRRKLAAKEGQKAAAEERSGRGMGLAIEVIIGGEWAWFRWDYVCSAIRMNRIYINHGLLVGFCGFFLFVATANSTAPPHPSAACVLLRFS